MPKDESDFGEEIILPEPVAQALVSDTSCRLVVEPSDESSESTVSVSKIDGADWDGTGNYSKLYAVGDALIAIEQRDDTVTEIVAFHQDHLADYLSSIFVDTEKRIMTSSKVGVDELESLDS